MRRLIRIGVAAAALVVSGGGVANATHTAHGHADHYHVHGDHLDVGPC